LPTLHSLMNKRVPLRTSIRSHHALGKARIILAHP
jgi:hypothetical protein